MLYSDFKKTFEDQNEFFDKDQTILDARTKPQNKETAKETQTKKRRSSKRTIGIFFCFVSIIISLALLSVEFFYQGGIPKALSDLRNDNAEYYYAIGYDELDTYDQAKSISDVARTQGGAGYIMISENYKVLLTVFLSAEDASKAAAKNDLSVIKIAKPQTPEVSLSNKNCATNAIKYVDTVIERIVDLSNTIQKNPSTPIADKLETIIIDYNNATEDFMTKTKNSHNVNDVILRSKINSAQSLLTKTKSLTPDNNNYLADVRLTAIAICVMF